jgi:hypothetical protein
VYLEPEPLDVLLLGSNVLATEERPVVRSQDKLVGRAEDDETVVDIDHAERRRHVRIILSKA